MARLQLRQRTGVVSNDLHCYLMHENQDNPWNRKVLCGDLDAQIRVDYQNHGDVNHRFCKIGVTVANSNPGEFQLKLTNTPMTEDLRELIEDHGGEVVDDDDEITATVDTSIKQVTYLRNLANQYRRTVGRGAEEYADRNWKWICRRTARALDHLADNITGFRKFHRHG